MHEKGVSKYFWLLDNKVQPELLKQYKRALVGREKSTLAKLVSLMEAKIPFPPKAYLTSAFEKFLGKKPAQDFFDELNLVVSHFEHVTGNSFGTSNKPLLITIQGDFCGAVRNIGVCPNNLSAAVHQFGLGSAFTLYVDFLESFSSLVLGCPHTDFRETFKIESEREGGAGGLVRLSEDQFLKHVKEYENLVAQKIGRPFPDTPDRQLLATLSYCARVSKDSGGDEIFMASQIQQVRFGASVQGVAYTRNPFSGKGDLYGVYQYGEKGQRAGLEPDEGDTDAKKKHALREKYPALFSALKRGLPEIEAAYRDVMECNFVSDEDGALYFTSFDKAETTARATVVSAVDLALNNKISDKEAALRIKPNDIEVLLHPSLDDSSRAKLQDLGSKGVTAAPGTAVGRVFYKMKDAMDHYRKAGQKKQDQNVILICDELLISDTPGLGMISGLLTKTGGISSHAAVMARANGIPCVVGYKGLKFDPVTNSALINGKRLQKGTVVTLEAGEQGRLFLGKGSLQNLSHQEGVVKEVSDLVTRVIKQEKIPLEVRVNINNAKDAATGLNFGADGVGLCRTENMFMGDIAIKEIRRIVFTQDPEKCKESFQKLEEIQYEDFRKIFEVMGERTVNIRLMDLPLHDLAPQSEADFKNLVKQLKGLKREHLRAVSDGLKEHNPMLGLRAVRFGIVTPQIYDMQIRAIIRGAYSVSQTGKPVNPGIMFPLICTPRELERVKGRVVEIEEEIRQKLKVPFGTKVNVRVGTMIELPAAALRADQLARIGEFFAFGTNDLTQTTMGVSRDDSAHYLPFYLENNILPSDPFRVLSEPVRELIEIAVRRGHRVRPDASFGICGEQGGDKSSLGFCLEKGLKYVSMSAYRVLPGRVALIRTAEDMKAVLKMREEAGGERASAKEPSSRRPRVSA